MAKQDLYKTAQQSAKLFKLIQDENLLESWVKNKIISAAEDISTVYQYLNYEKQFKDYSKMISESTDLSESKRAVLTSKLAEAKEKVKELKKKAAKDKSEKMSEDKDEMKVGDTKKTRTGELTKTSTGVVHKNTSYHDDGDEIASNAKSGKGVKSHAKAQSAAEKKEKAPAQKFSPKGAKTWGMKDNEKFDNRDKEVDEGSYLGKKLTAEAKMCPICKKDPCKCGKGNAKKKTVKEASNAKEQAAIAIAKKAKASSKVKEAIARAKDVLEGKGKKGDGNLANNAKPYDKVTKGDVIAGRLGKDEKGGKKEVVKESVELDRLKVLTQRLNG
jgi:hypothetical protein